MKEQTAMALTPLRATWGKPLTDAQHAELKAMLEDDLRRLVPGTAIAASAGPSDEALRALEPRARTRGLQLAGALRRLESGSYGICAECRSPIAYLRLSVIPETTVCVQCSGAREAPLRA